MENIDPRSYENILNGLYEGVYFTDRNKNIIFWNRGAEDITGFKSYEVVGSRCGEDILAFSRDKVMNLCKGQCPLSETMEDGRVREEEVFLQHKDGHKIPVLMRAIPRYDDGGKIIGLAEIFVDNSLKAAYIERVDELEKMVLLDPLTGLANKKYVEMNLSARFAEMQRYGWPFGLLFMNTDHFKTINEIHGRDVGDKVLKMIAKTLLNGSRPYDMIGRWEEEKFVAVIENVNESKLYIVANRFLGLVEGSTLAVGSKIVRATLSMGGTIATPKDTIESIVGRAVKLMEKSKVSGGNRITIKLE